MSLLSFWINLTACSGNYYPREIRKAGLITEFEEARWELLKLFAVCADEKGREILYKSQVQYSHMNTTELGLFIYWDTGDLISLVINKKCYHYHSIGFNEGEIRFEGHDDGVVLDYSPTLIPDSEILIKLENDMEIFPTWIKEAYRFGLTRSKK